MLLLLSLPLLSSPDHGFLFSELYHRPQVGIKRNFPEAVAALLKRFIPFFKGKTLALFTANNRRDLVYERLATPMAEAGYPVLSQGQGGLQRVLTEFRERGTPHCWDRARSGKELMCLALRSPTSF